MRKTGVKNNRYILMIKTFNKKINPKVFCRRKICYFYNALILTA